MRTLNRKSEKPDQTNQDPLMTEAKFAELQKKLESLKKKRPEAASEVSRLAELGDFSENVEYQLAKGRLRGINNRIMVLENQLNQAVIITRQKKGVVELGSTVTVESEGKKKTYQILGSSETDPEKGIISHNSPIGSALIGKKVGEKANIHRAGKEIEYKIIRVD